MARIRKRGNSWNVELRANGQKECRSFPSEALARAWADRMEARAEGMPQLRAALNDHKIAPLLPRRFRDALDKVNYTEPEIIASAFPIALDTGVYFLIRDGEISYIGKTTNILRRVQKHRQEGKKFDSFSFIPCAPEHLDELESTYICFLLPAENQKMC